MDAVQGRFTPSWPPLLLLTPSPSLQISLATRRQQPAGQAPACTAGTCTCVHVAGSCTTGSCGSRVPPSWGRHTLPHSVIDVVWRATYLPLPPCRCLYCTPLSLSQTLDAGVSPARPAGTCGAGTCLHCRYLRARQVASCPAGSCGYQGASTSSSPGNKLEVFTCPGVPGVSHSHAVMQYHAHTRVKKRTHARRHFFCLAGFSNLCDRSRREALGDT